MLSRIDRRREAAKSEILEAAWAIAAEKGLAGLTLQDVAHRVGMRAPSLYSYFESKSAIYDAMFADGYRALLADMDWRPPADPSRARASLVKATRQFMRFCRSNVPRYQLLFQRTIPGFEPSPESWAIALEVYENMRSALASIGITSQRAVDLWTAISTGLTDQQISNDPTGDRWKRLVPDAVDMFLAATEQRRGKR